MSVHLVWLWLCGVYTENQVWIKLQSSANCSSAWFRLNTHHQFQGQYSWLKTPFLSMVSSCWRKFEFGSAIARCACTLDIKSSSAIPFVNVTKSRIKNNLCTIARASDTGILWAEHKMHKTTVVERDLHDYANVESNDIRSQWRLWCWCWWYILALSTMDKNSISLWELLQHLPHCRPQHLPIIMKLVLQGICRWCFARKYK